MMSVVASRLRMDSPPQDEPLVALSELRHQSRATEALQTAMAKGRVAHAYLFSGPPGSGKRAVATAFAAALNCPEQPGVACGSCSTCVRIANNRHPDWVCVEREGAANIVPIRAIRERVISVLATEPHEARYRIFFFDEATALPGPAANALLKSLEEPPPRTVFILCTTSKNALLPTIRSRCTWVPFAPGESSTVDAPPEERPAFEQARKGRATDALAWAAAMSGQKEFVPERLLRLAGELHQGAVKAAKTGDLDKAQQLSGLAARASDAYRRLTKHNTHPQLTLEALALSAD